MFTLEVDLLAQECALSSSHPFALMERMTTPFAQSLRS